MDFPIDALPKELAALALAAGAAGNYPPEFVAVPGLSVLAASIGGRAVLDLQRTFRARPIIWTATSAPPGAAKSPGQRIATAPFRKCEAEWAEAHMEALHSYKAELVEYKASTKGAGDDGADAPAEPARRRCLMGDTTIEALVPVLQGNPAGGLLWAQPEITAIIGSLDQYRASGKGAGRASFLQLHDGDHLQVDRIGRGSLYVPEPRVSVTGGVVPERLGDLLGGADGLGARFLVAHLPDADLSLVNLDRDVSLTVVEEWDALVRGLMGDPTDGTPRAAIAADEVIVIRLGSDAKSVWKQAAQAFGKAWRRGETTSFGQQVIAKASLHLAHVALVLHVAANPERITAEVSGETMERAAALINYFVDSALSLDVIEASAAADIPTRRLDEGVGKLTQWLRRRPCRVARIGDLAKAHVAGCRTRDEVDQLVHRYGEVYPGCVTEGRLPGATSGPETTLILAPPPPQTSATSATSATYMSENQGVEGGLRSNSEINTPSGTPSGDKPVAEVAEVAEVATVPPARNGHRRPAAEGLEDQLNLIPLEALESGPDGTPRGWQP